MGDLLLDEHAGLLPHGEGVYSRGGGKHDIVLPQCVGEVDLFRGGEEALSQSPQERCSGERERLRDSRQV